MQNKLPNQDLHDVLEALQRNIERDINTIKVGTIEAYDATTQLASVQIVISRIVSIDVDGIKTTRKFPLLIEVPCFSLQGGDSFLQMPITKGDYCLLLFSDEDLEGWIIANETTPRSTRKHDLSDAICLVGINRVALGGFAGAPLKLMFSNLIGLEMDTSGVKVVGDLETDDINAKNIGALEVDSLAYRAGGVSGISGAITPTSSATVVNGIITAIT